MPRASSITGEGQVGYRSQVKTGAPGFCSSLMHFMSLPAFASRRLTQRLAMHSSLLTLARKAARRGSGRREGAGEKLIT